MDVDAALAEVRARAAGRTCYEGQPHRADEALAEEVERLRASELSAWNAAVVRDEGLDRLRASLRDLIEWVSAVEGHDGRDKFCHVCQRIAAARRALGEEGGRG